MSAKEDRWGGRGARRAAATNNNPSGAAPLARPPAVTRRTFLALGASTLALGAVGHFNPPADNTHELPPQWDLLERTLENNRIGVIDYAHIAFAPERPADLWAILAMLHEHARWPLPQRISVIADAPPEPDGPPVPFLGTLEISPTVRVTVDARNHEPRRSAVNGSRGRLVIFPARAEFVSATDTESHPIAWKTAHAYTPPAAAAAWALKLCQALRRAAADRAAVAFTDTGLPTPAPLRV